jgi:hypothetical protein
MKQSPTPIKERQFDKVKARIRWFILHADPSTKAFSTAYVTYCRSYGMKSCNHKMESGNNRDTLRHCSGNRLAYLEKKNTKKPFSKQV